MHSSLGVEYLHSLTYIGILVTINLYIKPDATTVTLITLWVVGIATPLDQRFIHQLRA